MLYKLKTGGDGLGSLEPLPFLDASDLQKREKHLENLLAEHLLDVLFEDAALLPIFQQRQGQAAADLYALTIKGDLVIFELKRGVAGEDAVLQVIRYAQQAGRWTFSELQRRYTEYLQFRGLQEAALPSAHKEAFQLEHELLPSEFNRRQQLFVVGSAANVDLIEAVDYWKSRGLAVEFLPYRIYQIGDDSYFEFFSLPYDRHRNPATLKGVLFDTNRTYNEDAIWKMMEQSRVAAYDDVKYVVEYLNPRDIVFFCHERVGVVAAGEVLGPVKKEGTEEEYRDVVFLTQVPNRDVGIVRFMPASDVSRVTGKGFFWARTIKVPYLSREEAQNLLEELRNVLATGT